MIFASALLLIGAIQSLRGPFYALLFYLGIAYFRPESWVYGEQLQALNLSFYVGLSVVALTLLFRERLAYTFPVWLIVAFCIHGLISTTISQHFEWCFVWWRQFAKVTVITVLIIGLINTEERLRLALLVIIFALGFEGVKQGWASVVLQQTAANQNAFDTLGDNNGVAVGMLMLAAVLLAMYQTAERRSVKAVFGFMLVGVLLRALTTYSRGGFLAFVTMCLVYWWRAKHRFRAALLVGVLVLLMFPLLPQQYWDRMSTITAGSDEMDSSSGGRLYFWQVARTMANDHPFFGVGNMGFQAAYDDYDTSDGTYGRGRAVHSSWFGVLADQGYVGLLMFTGILAMAFRAAGRSRAATRGRPHQEQLSALASALQTALVTAAVGGTFLSYHYVEILWHFLGLSFALERIVLRNAVREVATVPLVVGVVPALRAS